MAGTSPAMTKKTKSSPLVAKYAVIGAQSARLGITVTLERHQRVYVFNEATPSISISIFGFGNACTTQVVRAG